MASAPVVHTLRERPNSSWNNPNLSDFICSCGVEFIACDLAPSTSPDTPSLAAVHRVAEQMKLSGSAPWAVLTEADQLDGIPELAVVELGDGRLARRCHSPHVRWVFSDGTLTDVTGAVSFPVTVWWIPQGASITAPKYTRRAAEKPAGQVSPCWCGSIRGPRIPADTDGNGCLAHLSHANYVPAPGEPRWIEGWKAAMDWLAEYKGADGIALAHEMSTRLPAEYREHAS